MKKNPMMGINTPMNIKTEKYLRIQDWTYWQGLYHCADGWDTPNGEFHLTNDEAGEEPFFRLDFYNLPALEQIIQEGEFMEPTSPDFLKQAERFKVGEQDWFVGALYYSEFSPTNLCFSPTVFDPSLLSKNPTHV